MRRIGLLVLALALGTSGWKEAQRAYEEGRFRDALALYAEAESAAGEQAPAALCFDHALAALRAGEWSEAELAAERAAERGEAGFAPRRDFLRGNICFARSELYARQAAAPEAEPFAWDVALGEARRASEHWRAAAGATLDRAAAVRNLERALRWIAELERRKAEALARRPQGPQVADQPRPGEGEQKGQDTEQSRQEERVELDLEQDGGEELAPARLLELVREKEREKREARRAARGAAQSDVERDW